MTMFRIGVDCQKAARTCHKEHRRVDQRIELVHTQQAGRDDGVVDDGLKHDGGTSNGKCRDEHLEIVRMVKAVHMDNKELTAFLRAYASGMISLPEGMMKMEAAADPGMMEGTDDEE